MAEKRKDNKGRVLKTREVQRKDGTYQWTYDDFGKRRYIYARTLDELRRKKAELQDKLNSGIDYSALATTVQQLVERYIDLCSGKTYKTQTSYAAWLKMVSNETFLARRISDVKTSDCKLWLTKISKSGKTFNTVSSVHKLFRAAFNVACQDGVLARNPFSFRIDAVVKNDTQARIPLTDAECIKWLTFLCNDKTYRKWYDVFVLLVDTGMRISEFCGLTISDLDFENGIITVDKQLLLTANGEYYVQAPKTQSSIRRLPMSKAVASVLEHLLAARETPSEEVVIDGHSGFLMLTKTGKPMVEVHVYKALTRAERKYKRQHPEEPITHIFPHLFRHMACSRMLESGMSLKEIAMMLGHANISQIERTYAHADEDRAREKLAAVMESNSECWNIQTDPLVAAQ